MEEPSKMLYDYGYIKILWNASLVYRLFSLSPFVSFFFSHFLFESVIIFLYIWNHW